MIELGEGKQLDTAAKTETVRVLMIDDDEAFNTLVRGALKRHGYDVITVSNPVKALEIYTRHKDSIQLVLLDYSMPGLNGPKTFEWLRKLNPQIKVILCSGLEELHLRRVMAEHPLDAYIHKPLRTQEALTTIRQVMAQSVRQS